ncbi:MAG TPA: vitamin K epoxide reductase family protein [Candidatus Saccharimonadales bacterium]|nr:vitamin K epoxide reductase family protein [Candidatus Saccharimonadales bacterium]
MYKLSAFLNHARERSDVWIFTTMLISAVLSLIAAFVLSVESFHLAKNPDAILSCTINAVLNCASVMKHPSADLFGFPNSFIGLIAEPVVITVAVAGLAGVRFPRAFMAAAQVGYAAGLVFAYYLFFVSVFVIGALCPWCLLVTVSTTLVFMSLLHYNIREDNLYLSEKTSKVLKKWVSKNQDRFLTAVVLAAMIFLVLFKYHDGLF